MLTDFLSNLGGSPWLNILTTYYDRTSTPLTNRLTYNGATYVQNTYGTVVSEDNGAAMVNNAINSGVFPRDALGHYLIITAPDVSVVWTNAGISYGSQAPQTNACGWHDHTTNSGTTIVFSFISTGLNVCGLQSTSPNGVPLADPAASVIAHELVEAATHPFDATSATGALIGGWWDTKGNENGDKCAWTFGSTYGVSTSAGIGASTVTIMFDRDACVDCRIAC